MTYVGQVRIGLGSLAMARAAGEEGVGAGRGREEAASQQRKALEV